MHRAIPLLVLAAGSAGCVPDSVAPGIGEDDGGESLSADSAAVEGMPVGPMGDEASVGSEALPSTVSAAGEAGGPVVPAGPCDLTGRWLVTRREVATAIGSVEAAHTWYYYELAQTGAHLSVTKGLRCGENVRGISAVSANVDYPKVWPALMAKELDTGRTGTSAATASGCHVSLDKHYDVAGATVSFYEDPSQPLPSTSQQASGMSPGWEDWDGDGNPGYTMNVTGLATGQVYITSRSWSVWTGDVAGDATTFTLAVDWDSEQVVLGINGPPILSQAASGVKDGDASLHFVTFARLAASQATGSDSSICAAVRSLAPSLTPSASN
jgi:hypothetical protein